MPTFFSREPRRDHLDHTCCSSSPVLLPPTRFFKILRRRVEWCAAAKKIDVMVLYSEDALSRVFGGATAAQMETMIADELPKATEAATNSEIDLQFNLVHAGPVSNTL